MLFRRNYKLPSALDNVFYLSLVIDPLPAAHRDTSISLSQVKVETDPVKSWEMNNFSSPILPSQDCSQLAYPSSLIHHHL